MLTFLTNVASVVRLSDQSGLVLRTSLVRAESGNGARLFSPGGL